MAIASVCGSCVTLIIVIIIARVRAHRSRHHSGWISFVVVMVVVNFVFGYLVGEYNFFTNMLPYYDVISLNSYKNVDVSLDDINGNVLMDAGRVEFFVEGTQVGYKQKNLSCIVLTAVRHLESIYNTFKIINKKWMQVLDAE